MPMQKSRAYSNLHGLTKLYALLFLHFIYDAWQVPVIVSINKERETEERYSDEICKRSRDIAGEAVEGAPDLYRWRRALCSQTDIQKGMGTVSGSRSFYGERNREIRRLYREGHSMEALSEQYGLAHSTIRKIIYG